MERWSWRNRGPPSTWFRWLEPSAADIHEPRRHRELLHRLLPRQEHATRTRQPSAASPPRRAEDRACVRQHAAPAAAGQHTAVGGRATASCTIALWQHTQTRRFAAFRPCCFAGRPCTASGDRSEPVVPGPDNTPAVDARPPHAPTGSTVDAPTGPVDTLGNAPAVETAQRARRAPGHV